MKKEFVAYNIALALKELGFDDFALLGSIWEPVKSGCELSHVIEIFNRFQNEK